MSISVATPVRPSTFIALLLFAVLGLSGCAMMGVSTKQVSLDGELRPNDQVARLAIHVRQQFPAQPLDYHWTADLLSIDGKPVPASGVAFVQVNPGQHSLEYVCHFNFYVTEQGKIETKGRPVRFHSTSRFYLLPTGRRPSGFRSVEQWISVIRRQLHGVISQHDQSGHVCALV